MKSVKIISSFFLISIVFYSCSIEKRHFRPGYYIDWKKNKTESRQLDAPDFTLNQQQPDAESLIGQDTSSVANRDITTSGSEYIPLSEKNEHIATDVSPDLPVNDIHEISEEQLQSQNIYPEPVPEDEKELNTYSLMAFIFGLLSIFIFPLAIPGLILGKMAKKEIEADPDKYTEQSMKFAKTGIIVSLVIICLFGLALFIWLLTLLLFLTI